MNSNKKKFWYEYLYIASAAYMLLGIFNILFAWLGIICFAVPLVISLVGGGKTYCNKYCGRGQLFYLLGTKYKLSRNKPMPSFLKTKWFRYGFLSFFMIMFGNMIFSTYLVFAGANSLKEVVTLFWTWRLPWHWVNTSFVSPWIAQFAFGFYSIMLTSTLLGLATMLLYKPRSWCVYCPMGTMTQGICKLKHNHK
ncbi:MAG: 4Fe-4S binding protein [Clostridia bacterium]